MIEFRKLLRTRGDWVLQYREIPSEINWVPGTDGGDHAVYGPRMPINLIMEKNYGPWTNVPTVVEGCENG